MSYNHGARRALSRRGRMEHALRNLVMALAHSARADGKEELADELEGIEESLQRDFQTRRSRNEE